MSTYVSSVPSMRATPVQLAVALHATWACCMDVKWLPCTYVVDCASGNGGGSASAPDTGGSRRHAPLGGMAPGMYAPVRVHRSPRTEAARQLGSARHASWQAWSISGEYCGLGHLHAWL